MTDLLLKALIFGSAFAGTFLLVLSLLPDTEEAAALKRLGVSDEGERPATEPMVRILRPLLQKVTPRIPGNRLSEEDRSELHKKLLSGHMRDELTPEEFVALRAVMAVILPTLILVMTVALAYPISLPLWPALIALGYFYPDLWLKEKIRSRRRAILKSMPYTLDLLTLSVEAGLDFIAAIQRLVQKTKGNALLTEFGLMLREIRHGTTRSEALRSLSNRLQIEEINSFTTLLIQADQLGASIGNVLRAQSDQLRSQRFQAAEAAGARASQLILLPLVLCIFPAIFIIVAIPALLSFFGQGLL